ncbi:MAG: hypothetical protein K2K75_14165 [Muribaculaceae bacterium]|nr:hypothetical protein [Muribaculaceae bacterium]
MKKLSTVILLATALISGSACKSNKTEQTESQEGKTIVLYYSQTGATKAVAEELQKQLGCDIDSIVAINPYDGDYGQTIARWMQEKKDSVKVEVKPLSVNLDEYDTVFLGFPIWGGTYALPMASFLSENKLDGKNVVTFATFGSGGIEKATLDVAVALPGADVKEGYGVRNARVAKAPQEINRFLIENDYVEGEFEALPAFSEPTDVSDEEAAIFHAACDNYQFPLGNPVSVASRKTQEGTEYEFGVKSTTPDGQESNAIIYVIASEGSSPEFTRVVRE